jgi:hypothetical protein
MREGNSFSNKLKNFIIDKKGLLFTAVIVCAVVYFFVTAVNNASGQANSSAAVSLQNAVKNAAVQCYAIEGFYPPDVSYLEENYGIVIDKNFKVEYNCAIPNNLPIIIVINKYQRGS